MVREQLTDEALDAIILRERGVSLHRCLCTLSVWQGEDEYQPNAQMCPPLNADGGVEFCTCESCGPSTVTLRQDEPCDLAVSFCEEHVCPCPFGEIETEILVLARLLRDARAELRARAGDTGGERRAHRR